MTETAMLAGTEQQLKSSPLTAPEIHSVEDAEKYIAELNNHLDNHISRDGKIKNLES